ncbi:MAG: hypothetical protein AB1609_22740, partial [Bacillota bacterium]
PSVLQLCAYCGYEWPLGKEPACCPACGHPPRRVRFCTDCGCELDGAAGQAGRAQFFGRSGKEGMAR